MRWQWMGWAVFALLALAAFVVLAWVSAAPYKPGVVVGCATTEEGELLSRLTVEALDEAYQQQIIRLYEIWLRDPKAQPQRAQAGTSNAVDAWLGARRSVGVYRPPECK